MLKLWLKCQILFLSKKTETNPEVLWSERQFGYSISFSFEIWHDSNATVKMSPESLYEPELRFIFSAETQYYISFTWLCSLQVFPITPLW